MRFSFSVLVQYFFLLNISNIICFFLFLSVSRLLKRFCSTVPGTPIFEFLDQNSYLTRDANVMWTCMGLFDLKALPNKIIYLTTNI